MKRRLKYQTGELKQAINLPTNKLFRMDLCSFYNPNELKFYF